MSTYTTQELVPSTKMVRNFSSYLSKIETWELSKVGVVKNSEVKYVILPVEEYDAMNDEVAFQDAVRDSSIRSKLKTLSSKIS